MFSFFKRKRKEEKKKMATIEDLKQAYETLSEEDKAMFKQSLNTEETADPAPQKEEEPAVNPEETGTQQAEAEEAQNGVEKQGPEEPAATTGNATEIAAIREDISGLKGAIESLKAAVIAKKQAPEPVVDDKAAELDKLTARYTSD